MLSMNTIQLPDDNDWVSTYGKKRLLALVCRKLNRPKVYLIAGFVIGALTCLVLLSL